MKKGTFNWPSATKEPASALGGKRITATWMGEVTQRRGALLTGREEC